MTRSGLSPRVRGNPSPAQCPLRSDLAVYPRECGGTALLLAGEPVKVGLSPRVRGNRHCIDTTSYSIGSIPASAGEPGAQSPTWNATRVYPRECGGTGREIPCSVRS